MDRIGIAGLTLHDTDLDGLEDLRRTVQDVPATFLRELADELAASEVVLLATCNRVEVAYARESGHLPGPRDLELLAAKLALPEDSAARTRLWIRTGRNAVHHVLRVASSLDSLVVGEDQILAQVRGAFERARELGLIGGLLAPVFEAAVQVGKQVRTETDLSHHSVSVVSLGVQHLAASLKEVPEPSLALLGAGRMGELVATSVRDAGLSVDLIVNRTRARAEELAARFDARALDFDEFHRLEQGVDGILAATSSPRPVLDAKDLLRLASRTPYGGPLVAVDLALPRDLEPVDDPSVELIDIEGLRARAEENRALRRKAAGVAEELVEQKLGSLTRRVSDQRVADVLAEVFAETNDMLDYELRRLLSKRMAHLGDLDRRLLERWARTTFGRLAHAPMRAFKNLAAERNGHQEHVDE